MNQSVNKNLKAALLQYHWL